MTQAIAMITADMTIGDVVENYPEIVDTLTDFGVHCLGCHVSPYERIEDGFRGHGMSDTEIQAALVKLNEVVAKNGSAKVVSPTVDVQQATLGVTDFAATKIKEVLATQQKQGLRVSVQPGGCSGFKYGMTLDDAPAQDDVVIQAKGIQIFVDKKSLGKLNGAKVDYVDSLQGAGFKITNPSASSSCGCGESFR